MEDAHATVLRLGDDDSNSFFAVYDGHGGDSAPIYLERALMLATQERRWHATPAATCTSA